MRKLRQHITGGLLTTSLLLVAPQMHARLTRLFGPLHPKNNLEDCSPAVRKHLTKIDKKWGPAQFDCRGGFVRSLYFPVDSLAAHEINRFVKDYWRLFDSEPVSLIDAGTPWRVFVLKRHGLPFHAREIDSGTRPGPDGGTLAFYDVGIEAAFPAGFSAKPAIDKERANAEALKIAARRGHLPNRIESTDLVIRNHCLKDSTPELVWWVSIQEKGNKKSVSCFIDANTGKACEWYQGCASSSDAFEM
jgi:hypothetical protein